MWTREKSVILSKLCILFFSGILVLVAVSAPWLTHWFVGFSRADLMSAEPFFLATIYTGFFPAAYLLYSMYCLLRRIETDQVFIRENVESLRRISWSCFLGAAISLVSVFYYFPWAFVAMAAAFMGLIVRVVKNVVAKAIELQEEVDYTV